MLRRGLGFSRREKGNDHEETLAHLAALAAHYEQLGQPEAARPFAEEHARLKGRKKAEGRMQKVEGWGGQRSELRGQRSSPA